MNHVHLNFFFETSISTREISSTAKFIVAFAWFICTNTKKKRKWLIRFSKFKQRNVLQLERRIENWQNSEMCQFNDDLNKLISFKGFWSIFQINTFHRLLSICCSKVCIFWSSSFESKFVDMSRKWQRIYNIYESHEILLIIRMKSFILI